MSFQRNALLCVAVMAITAVPALAQTSDSSEGGTDETASLPDFTGVWQHPSSPWSDPPVSGPGPITNLSRWPESAQIPNGEAGSAGLPATTTGISNYDQLVGDWKNPIL